MRASCPSCQTSYNIDDKRIPPGGAKLKCAKCQTTFPIRAGAAPAPSSAAVAMPGTGGGDAVPLPGMGGPSFDPGQRRWDDEATRVMPIPAGYPGAVPLPGHDDAGAVPLPGHGDAGAIPLPGEADADGAIPLPGNDGADAYGAPAHADGAAGAVPLPGFGEEPAPSAWDAEATRVAAIPLPSAAPAWQDEATRVASIPLPGAAYPEAVALPPPPAGDFAPHAAAPAAQDMLDFALPPPPTGDSAHEQVPLPGADVPEASAMDFDFADPPSDAAAAIAMPPPEESAPAAPPSFDFADFGAAPPPPPAAAASELDFALPPPSPATAPAMDFSDLPAPKSSAPADDMSIDFADLPPPPPPETPRVQAESIDFDLPAPAAPPPPPPAPRAAPQPIDFGDVDFGDPAPAAAAPARPGAPAPDLEFDPTAPAGRDELEADLSAPLPPRPSAPGASDGLEMLSFIDDTAKEAGAATGKATRTPRYHVRRRSGKVFGPFEEGVVIKMLEDGQLLGNEDVSLDQETWTPIGTVPAFQEPIQKLMDGTAGNPADAPAADPRAATQAASMDRLKQLYEGRMAAIAVVDRRESSEKLRKRLPLFIGAGVVALLLAIGGSLGFTRVGVFGLKYLMPAKISPGSAEFAQLEQAKAALLADTFESYKAARELSGKLLAVKEYPEARAVWNQAVYYLQRRYAASSPAELAIANTSLEDIALLGRKNVEVVKALAGDALVRKAPDEALAVLLEAKSRAENDADFELDLLASEAYVAKGDTRSAEESLQRVLGKQQKSAKALHALGNLFQARNEADKAVKAYSDALAADPRHVISAVELAAVELLVRKNLEQGAQAVEQALIDENRALLGPAEVARARSLRGVALATQFKQKEAIEEFELAKKLDPNSLFVKVNLARVLLAQRDFEKAMPLYREAVGREPGNLEYTDGYLSSLISLGKMSDALTEVGKANARFPGNARIAYLYGRVSDALDEGADAEKHYKRAISGDPSLHEASLYLARFYLRFRRIADARPYLETAVEKAPDNAAIRAGTGELALADSDLPRAEAEFKRAVQLEPTLADAHLGLAKVAYERGDYSGAKAHVDRALELDVKIKNGRLQRGLILWRLGDLAGAVAELEQAKLDDPKSTRASITTGAVKLAQADNSSDEATRMGALKGAEVALLAAITAEPSNPDANFYLARVKNRRQEHTQAIDAMKTALEHGSKRPAFRYEMGVIYRDAKKMNEAIEEWKAAIALEPKHADALEALGQAYLEAGNFEEAIGYFEKALEAEPARTRVLAAIGDCYFQAMKWSQAVGTYQRALARDPSLTHVYYKIGRAFTEQNQHAQAINWFQRATKADAANAMPYWYLGYAYKEKGKKKDAVAAFKAYLARKPDADDKKEIDDEIYDLER